MMKHITAVSPLWSAQAEDMTPDTHVAFRGVFACDADTEVEICLAGASWFGAWLAGDFLTEGPARFLAAYPEYQAVRVRLSAGTHLLAVQVHHNGVDTRLLADIPPFLRVEICEGTRCLPVEWRCLRLPGYAAGLRRFTDCLGWIEWVDTRAWPAPEWREAISFDDAEWSAPVAVSPLPSDHAPWAPVVGAETRYPLHTLDVVATGSYTEQFGYERDDPPARLFLRDLAPTDVPAQGTWFRYDLGRVRLMHPVVVLDVPVGTPVEIAYSETLHQGRVVPWVTFSAGSSCSLDHFVARGGVQEFSTLEPRGGRYLEVHIGAPAEQVRVLSVACRERCHFAEPEGGLASGDACLDAIWSIGVETLRACAEDTIVDTPTRERGAWMGDSLSVGLDIAAAAYGDLSIFRRMLVLAARGAREDGLVAGLTPGTIFHLSTYAAQWASAAVHYWELSGDAQLLSELYPAACRNMEAFAQACQDDGLPSSFGWAFVDWGYVANAGSDMALNLHYLAALGAMQRWATAVGDQEGRARYAAQEDRLRQIITQWLDGQRVGGQLDSAAVGYHRLVLALRAGLLPELERAVAVEAVKAHVRSCFPYDPSAPRLADPGVQSIRVFTPYFAHFALPVLIEQGEMDFVLDVYRRCWGWAMGDGRTTWVEVFDHRWSHSHHWSGCPTWQLSRYLLGLWPRFDLGEHVFELRLQPGSLSSAKGRVPIGGSSGVIDVEWTRQPDGSIIYHLSTPEPIQLIRGDSAEWLPVRDEYREVFTG